MKFVEKERAECHVEGCEVKPAVLFPSVELPRQLCRVHADLWITRKAEFNKAYIESLIAYEEQAGTHTYSACMICDKHFARGQRCVHCLRAILKVMRDA